MKISKCVIEGYSGVDNERYQEMFEIVESCKTVGIAPPKEAVVYIAKHDRGEEDSIVHLRPQIDKGVSIRQYGEEKAIIINLEEIDKSIDFIRIYKEDYTE